MTRSSGITLLAVVALRTNEPGDACHERCDLPLPAGATHTRPAHEPRARHVATIVATGSCPTGSEGL
jgi:hypothetical protein